MRKEVSPVDEHGPLTRKVLEYQELMKQLVPTQTRTCVLSAAGVPLIGIASPSTRRRA